MAPGLSVLLSLACLRWQLASGLGRDSEDTEYFPLSGGIDNGVQVSIKVKMQTAATIEFLTNAREPAFRFVVDGTNKEIIRSKGSNGAVKFGGWPPSLDGASEATFVFTKRPTDFAVSIGGERFPWYDFAHGATSEAITHVSVNNANDLEPEVTLERPMCSMQCHADECTNDAGENKCDTPPCNYIQGDGSGVLRTCMSGTTTTAGANEHCCDGLPRATTLSSSDINQTYAVIASDSAYLVRACTAFSTSCSSAGAHAGTKAQILSVDTDLRQATAYVPHAQDVDLDGAPRDPATTEFTFPFFALRKSWKINQKILYFADKNPFSTNVAGYTTADGHTGLITRSKPMEGVEDIPKGWYINLVQYSRLGVSRWTEWSEGARSNVRNTANLYAGNRSIWISDEPKEPQGPCTNFALFDTNGANCTDYTAGKWCTHHAIPTEAGCSNWGYTGPVDDFCREDGAIRYMPGGREGENGTQLTSRNAAGYQCCQCGGGFHEHPSITSSGMEIIF